MIIWDNKSERLIPVTPGSISPRVLGLVGHNGEDLRFHHALCALDAIRRAVGPCEVCGCNDGSCANLADWEHELLAKSDVEAPRYSLNREKDRLGGKSEYSVAWAFADLKHQLRNLLKPTKYAARAKQADTWPQLLDLVNEHVQAQRQANAQLQAAYDRRAQRYDESEAIARLEARNNDLQAALNDRIEQIVQADEEIDRREAQVEELRRELVRERDYHAKFEQAAEQYHREAVEAKGELANLRPYAQEKEREFELLVHALLEVFDVPECEKVMRTFESHRNAGAMPEGWRSPVIRVDAEALSRRLGTLENKVQAGEFLRETVSTAVEDYERACLSAEPAPAGADLGSGPE